MWKAMEIPPQLIPKTKSSSKEALLYERMRDAAFKPVKNIIEYEKLHNALSEDDLHRLAHELASNWLSWCMWLKYLDKQKEQRE